MGNAAHVEKAAAVKPAGFAARRQNPTAVPWRRLPEMPGFRGFGAGAALA
jgi:hypothetical protein